MNMIFWLMLSYLLLMPGCGFRPSTPLERAAAAGNLRELQTLLSAGVSQQELDGALVAAAREGGVASIQPLITAGADPNVRAGVNGWTVLMHAIHKDQLGAVQELLAAGADPRLRLANGQVALDYAIAGVKEIDNGTAGKCQTETVQRLVKAAPDLVTPELLDRTRAQQDKCPKLKELLTLARQNLQAGLPAQ